LAHVVAVERVPQAVADHAVDVFHVAHFLALAQVGDMGAHGHVFLAASDHNVGVAQLNVLRTQGNSAQAGAAHLVNAVMNSPFLRVGRPAPGARGSCRT